MSGKKHELLALKTMALVQLSIAQRILKHTGHLLPCAIVPRADGSLIYADLPDDKHLWRAHLTALLRWENAQRYFVLCEAWACDLQVDGPDSLFKSLPGLPVHDNPLRYEIIMVAAVERTGDTLLVHQQFTHEPQGIKLYQPRVFNRVKLPTLPTSWSC